MVDVLLAIAVWLSLLVPHRRLSPRLVCDVAFKVNVGNIGAYMGKYFLIYLSPTSPSTRRLPAAAALISCLPYLLPFTSTRLASNHCLNFVGRL